MNPRFVAFPPPAVKASLCQPSDISTNYTLDTADTVELTKANSLNPSTTHFPQQHTLPPHEHPQQYKLPPKRPKYKRVFHLPVLSTHRRLIVIVVLINLALLALGIALQWYQNLPAIAYLVISNITVTVLIRQQRVINLLFFLATCTKTRLPLRLRWMLGKIYHFGGLHSACAVSATVWLLLFTISATVLRSTNSPNAPSEMLLLLTFVIDALLLTIVVLALPTFRSRFHNTFEATHCFLGWTALFFVWLFTIFLIRDFKTPTQSLSQAFFTSVSPYLLIIITLSIISPWIYLRKVPVSITKPSNHAIVVSFEKGVLNAFPGSSSAISLAPLYEWHSFANICTPGKDGFRLIISRAGDWTSSVIDNPPSHFWVRGIPTAGMATIRTLFQNVLFVATGSGIGPVLPHLLHETAPSQLLWCTRTPEKTFGRELVQEVINACADAVIHDTTQHGKPDMVQMSYKLCKHCGAEAVIIISNQKLTRKVVYGMEARGIPAFGAIWDS